MFNQSRHYVWCRLPVRRTAEHYCCHLQGGGSTLDKISVIRILCNSCSINPVIMCGVDSPSAVRRNTIAATCREAAAHSVIFPEPLFTKLKY